MNSLHPHTIAHLHQFLWKHPDKNTIGTFASIRYEHFPSGQELFNLLNYRLSHRHCLADHYAFEQHEESAMDVSPLENLREQLANYLGLPFKNTYQFAAFLSIWDSKCPAGDEHAIEQVLRQLKPEFLAVDTDPGVNEKEDPDTPLQIQLLIDIAPDHILRNKVLNKSAYFRALIEGTNFFEQAVLLMEYFLDDQLEDIPEIIRRKTFGSTIVKALFEKYPGHPLLRQWVYEAYAKGYHQDLDQSGTYLPYLSEEDQQNREIVQRFISRNPRELKHAIPPFRADKELVRWAVAQDARLLAEADTSLQTDPDLLFLAILQSPHILTDLLQKGMDPEILRPTVYTAAKLRPKLWRRLPQAIFDNFPELIPLLLPHLPEMIPLAGEAERSSRELAIKLAEIQPLFLQHFHEDIRSDKTIILPALKKDGRLIVFIAESLKRDPEIIELVLQTTPGSFVFLPKDLQPEKEQLLRWIEWQPLIVRHLNLATHQPADTDWQRVYISGMLNMTNDGLHSVPIPNVAEDVDPDDLF